MSVEDESVSPGDAAAADAQPAQFGRASRGWHWAVPVVAAIAGALFAASALTAHGTDLRAGRRTGLPDLIRASEQKVRTADANLVTLQNQVQQLTASQDGGAALDRANAAAAALAAPAGLTAVAGPGLTVRLADAPRDQTGLPAGVMPDDLVVHQQDVQAVVNALWAGGAEAMQLMDQRVVSTSAVRCVGNTLVLQGRVYSPPFRIAAIGDPTRMRQALDAAPGVRSYRQFVDVVGLGYQVTDQEELTVPPYQGSLRMAVPSTGSGATR